MYQLMLRSGRTGLFHDIQLRYLPIRKLALAVRHDKQALL